MISMAAPSIYGAAAFELFVSGTNLLPKIISQIRFSF
jgi:hypothetical protein